MAKFETQLVNCNNKDAQPVSDWLRGVFLNQSGASKVVRDFVRTKKKLALSQIAKCRRKLNFDKSETVSAKFYETFFPPWAFEINVLYERYLEFLSRILLE